MLPESGCIQNEVDLGALMRHIERCDDITVDTETTGLNHTRDLIAGVAVGTPVGQWYVPFRHVEGRNMAVGYLTELGELLHSRKRVVGYNYKFDSLFLAADGIAMPPIGTIVDAMLAGQLLDENVNHKLETRGILYGVGDDLDERQMLDTIIQRFGGTKNDAKGKLFYLPGEQVAPYACNDIRLTRALFDFYTPYLEQYGLTSVFYGVCEYAETIARMEENGMQIDATYCEQQIEGMEQRISEIREQIFQLAGGALNLQSHKQVQRWLGLDSSAKDRLIDILLAHPDRKDIDLLLTYRHLITAANTYYGAYLDTASSELRVHPNLNLVGTVSGRPSCTRPNMLNTPRNSEVYAVRNAFVASEGYEMQEYDLSQAEMRVGAYYAGETNVLKAFAAGLDAHQATADKMGISRAIAKNVNFSYLYGIGPGSFSYKYHVPKDAAEKYLKDYGKAYPGYRRLLEDERKKADREGFVRMWTGRMRHYNCFRGWCPCEKPKAGPFVHGANVGWSAHPKDACNNLVQGTVSEMIRIAIPKIAREIPWARMLLTVYDSLMFEIPIERSEEARSIIPRLILDNDSGIPMRVDCKIGQRWGSLKEVA